MILATKKCPADGGAWVLGGSDPPVCRAVNSMGLVKRVAVRILVGRAFVGVSVSDRDPKVAAKTERFAQFCGENFSQFDGVAAFVEGVHLLLIWTSGRGPIANLNVQALLYLHRNAPRVSGGALSKQHLHFPQVAIRARCLISRSSSIRSGVRDILAVALSMRSMAHFAQHLRQRSRCRGWRCSSSYRTRWSRRRAKVGVILRSDSDSAVGIAMSSRRSRGASIGRQ